MAILLKKIFSKLRRDSASRDLAQEKRRVEKKLRAEGYSRKAATIIASRMYR